MKLPIFICMIALTLVPQESLNGVSLGATKEKVVALLRDRGMTLTPVKEMAPPQEAFLIAGRDGVASDSILFCRGLVSSYTMSIAGGTDAFIRLVASETAANGQGTYQAGSDDTASGQLHHLDIRWTRRGVTYTIGLVRLGGADQVSRSIQVTPACSVGSGSR